MGKIPPSVTLRKSRRRYYPWKRVKCTFSSMQRSFFPPPASLHIVEAISSCMKRFRYTSPRNLFKIEYLGDWQRGVHRSWLYECFLVSLFLYHLPDGKKVAAWKLASVAKAWAEAPRVKDCSPVEGKSTWHLLICLLIYLFIYLLMTRALPLIKLHYQHNTMKIKL